MLILYLIKKEFLQMNRNHFLKVLALVYPVAVMCVFPWVMRMDVKNVAVVVVDNDHSILSQQLVHRIEASHYFVFKGQKASYTDALSAVEQCEADVIVEVPAHFERNKTRGEHPQIQIAVNAVNGSKGMLGASYMNQIVTASVAPEGLLTTLRQRVSTLYLYNKHLDSKRFMIPSLFGILLMIICG
ncbi:MAG: ABC transporter permease, partial [Prevotella salivae]|uniref:ABC transporter permease n=1 Tax=Segatella salivae TaxID=228604 RepID=UPI001CB47EB6